MTKSNLQVRVSSDVKSKIARLAPHSKSAFVREAIEEKIQRETFQRMEDQWIRALRKKPENKKEAEAWFKAQEWGGR